MLVWHGVKNDVWCSVWDCGRWSCIVVIHQSGRVVYVVKEGMGVDKGYCSEVGIIGFWYCMFPLKLT